jgi:hypothetical protein
MLQVVTTKKEGAGMFRCNWVWRNDWLNDWSISKETFKNFIQKPSILGTFRFKKRPAVPARNQPPSILPPCGDFTTDATIDPHL